MNGIVTLVALFIVFGIVLGAIAFLAYRRVLRRAKGVERGLKMVPLLIHLPPPSDDTDSSGNRDVREVMREKISQAQALYDLIAGTAQSGFKSNFYGQRHIAFEIVASNGLVHYFAAVPIALVGIVEQAIVTAYPGARLEEVEDHNIFNPQGRLTGTVGGELVLKHQAAYPIALLDQMERDPMVGLLNALSKIQLGDGAVVQIMLRPANPKWTKRAVQLVAKKRHTHKGGLGFGAVDLAKAAVKAPEQRRQEEAKFEPSKLEESLLEAIEEKTKHPGYEVLVRVLASSPSYDRAQVLLRSITTAFALFEAPGSNGFQFIPARDIQGLVTAFIFRFFPPPIKDNVLNSVELATLFHLPDAQFTPTTQVERQQSKQVDGPSNIPQAGLLLGYNFYRGVKKEIHLGPEDRRRHTYIIGQTGTGKSTILENLAVQDMLAGNGFAFIDPHGDTAEKLLTMVPKERAEDVVYFNPGDMEHPLGLNLFEFTAPEQKDFLIQESINMLYKLYDPQHTGIIGPRFEHWYRNAALTLMADPHGASFIEIPKVFTDSAYLKDKFQYLSDPTVVDFWLKEMGQTSDYHKSEMLGFFVSKFGAFQSNEMMRNIIGQTRSSFDLREIMDHKKILIVNLGKGSVGELNSQLLGMIFVMKFQAAAMSRTNVPEDQRPDFCLYVDEFQNFSTDSFASILSEARKYHLNLIVANQFIGQLSDEIRDAVFGNVGTMVSYRCGPEDAEFLVKQFEPVFDVRDMVNLPNYNAIMKLLVGGLPSQPFSITMLPQLGEVHPEMGLAVKQLSAAKYGVLRHTVETDIFARLQNLPRTVVPNAATTALVPPVALAPVIAAAPAVSPPPALAAPPTPAPAAAPITAPPTTAVPATASAPTSQTIPVDEHAAMLPPAAVPLPVATVPPTTVATSAPPSPPVAAPAPTSSDSLSLSQLRATVPPLSSAPATPNPAVAPAGGIADIVKTAPVAPLPPPAAPPPPAPPPPPSPVSLPISAPASPATPAPAVSSPAPSTPIAPSQPSTPRPADTVAASPPASNPPASNPSPTKTPPASLPRTEAPKLIEARETDGRAEPSAASKPITNLAKPPAATNSEVLLPAPPPVVRIEANEADGRAAKTDVPPPPPPVPPPPPPPPLAPPPPPLPPPPQPKPEQLKPPKPSATLPQPVPTSVVVRPPGHKTMIATHRTNRPVGPAQPPAQPVGGQPQPKLQVQPQPKSQPQPQPAASAASPVPQRPKPKPQSVPKPPPQPESPPKPPQPVRLPTPAAPPRPKPLIPMPRPASPPPPPPPAATPPPPTTPPPPLTLAVPPESPLKPPASLPQLVTMHHRADSQPQPQPAVVLPPKAEPLAVTSGQTSVPVPPADHASVNQAYAEAAKPNPNPDMHAEHHTLNIQPPDDVYPVSKLTFDQALATSLMPVAPVPDAIYNPGEPAPTPPPVTFAPPPLPPAPPPTTTPPPLPPVPLTPPPPPSMPSPPSPPVAHQPASLPPKPEPRPKAQPKVSPPAMRTTSVPPTPKPAPKPPKLAPAMVAAAAPTIPIPAPVAPPPPMPAPVANPAPTPPPVTFVPPPLPPVPPTPPPAATPPTPPPAPSIDSKPGATPESLPSNLSADSADISEDDNNAAQAAKLDLKPGEVFVDDKGNVVQG